MLHVIVVIVVVEEESRVQRPNKMVGREPPTQLVICFGAMGDRRVTLPL